MREVGIRRYRILSVLGQGGFGRVYHARLEDDAGFAKDVALKVLLSEDLSDAALRRFRDEARILGLLRDRAIVSVDAPTRIGGRWAVVMELVDGASCSALLRHRGPFPPGVALEVVGEVARALQHAWEQPGPDGRPVRLLHRDLKPSNLQLTPQGHVKILDFGIARADFAHREARTTAHIGGTPGYIAPERLAGREGPEADVYSLGVVLHVLLNGGRPPTAFDARDDHPTERDATGLLADAFALARSMIRTHPGERPTASEVERSCRALRRQADGPWLRDWMEAPLPPLRASSDDPLVGDFLTETLVPVPSPPPARPSPLPWLALGGTTLFAAAAVIATGSALLTAVWWRTQRAAPVEPPPVVLADVLHQEDAPAVAEVHTDQPTVDEAPPASPTPELPRPSTSPRAKQSSLLAPHRPSASGRVELGPALLRPAGPAVTTTLSLTSSPPGVLVSLDGRSLGSTPLQEVVVAAGAHELTLVDGDHRTQRSVHLDQPTVLHWDMLTDSWSPHPGD